MPRQIRVVNKDSDFTPLPEGTYDCKILEIEQTTSSKNNPQLEVSLEIVDGPYAGKKRKRWYSLTEKAGWSFRKLCDVLDVPIIDNGKTSDGALDWNVDLDELIGRVVRYDVTIRKFENKMNNQFDGEEVSEFDPYYQEIMQSRQTAAPAQSAPAVAAAAAPAPAVQAAPAAAPAQARRRTVAR